VTTKWLWTSMFAGFAALNLYVLVVSDLSALWAYLGGIGPWGTLLGIDLLCALMIGAVWITRDARTKGLSSWPYLVLTVATGSLGLLLYLVRHDDPRSGGRA